MATNFSQGSAQSEARLQSPQLSPSSLYCQILWVVIRLQWVLVLLVWSGLRGWIVECLQFMFCREQMSDLHHPTAQAVYSSRLVFGWISIWTDRFYLGLGLLITTYYMKSIEYFSWWRVEYSQRNCSMLSALSVFLPCNCLPNTTLSTSSFLLS